VTQSSPELQLECDRHGRYKVGDRPPRAAWLEELGADWLAATVTADARRAEVAAAGACVPLDSTACDGVASGAVERPELQARRPASVSAVPEPSATVECFMRRVSH